MTPELERQILIQTINSFVQVLSARGTPFQVPEEDELASMSMSDLIRLSRSLERVARTPM